MLWIDTIISICFAVTAGWPLATAPDLPCDEAAVSWVGPERDTGLVEECLPFSVYKRRMPRIRASVASLWQW